MSADCPDMPHGCQRSPEEKDAGAVSPARVPLALDGDERWEQIIADPTPRPKLVEFFRESMAEGSELLDLDRL